MYQLRPQVSQMTEINPSLKTNYHFKLLKIGEKGAIIILMPFIVIMLISLIALAVDSGNLYRTKLELQTVADTSTLAAAGSYVSETNDLYRFPPPGFNPLIFGQNYLENRTRLGVQSGIEYQNIGLGNNAQDPDSRYLDPDYIIHKGVMVALENGAYVVRTDPLVQVPTLLMQVFQEGKTTGIEVNVRARIAPANVVFIADISSSSLCPEVGPCICQTAARRDLVTGDILTCPQEAINEGLRRGIVVRQKFERMAEAFLRFLRAFDSARDRVSLVLFNNSAWTAVPFSSTAGGAITFGFDTNDFINVFSSLVDKDDTRVGTSGFIAPKGSTNISDALYAALEESARAGLLNMDSDVSYILLSDGAPTAMRFKMQGAGEDLLSFNVAWTQEIRDQDTNDLIATNSYFAPGAFMDTLAYKSLPDSRMNPQIAPNLLPTEYLNDPLVPMILPCHSDYAIALELANADIDVRANGVSFCVGASWRLESICPSLVANRGGRCSNVSYGSSASVRDSLDPGPAYYRNLYYFAALEAARLVRINRGTIYTVGWGNAIAIDPSDPFQNPDDDASLKSVLLADIANDELAASAGVHPGFGNANYNSYEGLQSRDPGVEKRGAYYEAPDTNKVEEALKLITRKIKLKLLR